MKGDAIAPFGAHVELLRSVLAQRASIVARIEGLLNAQRKPAEFLQDVRHLRRSFEECFFPRAGAASHALPRALEAARVESGFKPREYRGLHNDLVDPAEMMSRAFLMWRQTRWPGNYGRGRYAQTLFNLYLLRLLKLLSLRLWDDGVADTGARLAELESLLDGVWKTSPPDQPVLLRDARWLIPLAQSPTTEELAGYFAIAEHVAEHLPAPDSLEVQRAGTVMAGGHLRSQLLHVATQKGAGLDDRGLLLGTRKSNALDIALLVQSLVPLLEAYEDALAAGDDARRLEWASAILQGISPDPELFLNCDELLGPYSIIEYLFVAEDAGHASYTATGERHLRLLAEYRERMQRMARALHTDCTRFRPTPGSYSPYGALYGFSSQLLEHMALKSLQPDAETRFRLEQVFEAGGAEQLAWVSGWRKLPHVPKEVIERFDYPQRFAEDVFARVERALQRAASGEAPSAVGRLVVDAPPGEKAGALPALPARYVLSSDRAAVASDNATHCEQADLLHSRTEGELVVSFPTPSGWTGISKDVLTDIVGAGATARVVDLPAGAAAVLRLTCPRLVATGTQHVVVMGVAGCGKSTLAERLATELAWPFAEGDRYHPPANVAKMAAGVALTDADRLPWLETLAAWIAEREAEGTSSVLACSALKRSYRDVLRGGAPRVRFVHLRGSAEILAARLGGRSGHFFPSELLASQLATLEPLGSGEDGIEIDIALDRDSQLREALDALGLAPGP
jgi:gluconokinase